MPASDASAVALVCSVTCIAGWTSGISWPLSLSIWDIVYQFWLEFKNFKCTISSSDVLPSSLSDKFDSAGVDLCHLPEAVSLVDCKFPMHDLEAFRFCDMAENEDNECFQGCN